METMVLHTSTNRPGAAMIKHSGPISGIDTYRSRYVATAGYDNQVILWDMVTRRSLARGVHDHLANQCRFSACGRFLVSASSDYTARVWSVPDMRVIAILAGHDDDVEMAIISPDGARVATASRDHTIGIFRSDGRLERRLFGHGADVLSVEWTHDGYELISSSDDGTVRRWSVATGEQLENIDLQSVETDTMAVTETGLVYAGNDQGRIAIIDRTGVRFMPAHQAGIKRIIYEQRRQLVLTASYDRTVKVWSVKTAVPEAQLSVDVPDIVWLRACALSETGDLVFGTFGSSYARFSLIKGEWDLGGIDDTAGLNAVGHTRGAVYAIGDAGIVFRDGLATARPGSLCNFIGSLGGVVVTGGQAGTLFDADSGEILYRHRSPLNCSAAFVRHGRQHVIVGTYTGEGLVFRDDGSGRLNYVAALSLHDNAVKGLAANDEQIFSVCASGAASFTSIETLERQRYIPRAHRKISNGATVLPDGRFASVSRDRSLRFWARDGTVQEFETPHTHSIKCIAASPSGNLLATGSYDGVVALFDWQQQAWRGSERLTAAGISSLSASAEPNRFLASSYDGNIYKFGDRL